MNFLRCLGLVVLVSSCVYAKSVEYIKNSMDYVSEGIDSHDVDTAIKEAVKSFELEFLSNLNVDKDLEFDMGKKIFVISRIDNKTKENIDTETIARQLMREIRKGKNGKRIDITNAISGETSKKDSTIDEVRNLRDNEEFDQNSIVKRGNLVAPNYSLSGKIHQKTSNLPDKKKRIDYTFSWSVVDLKNGTLEWDFDYIISKISDQDSKNSQIEVQNKERSSTISAKSDNNDSSKDDKQGEYAPIDGEDSIAHFVFGLDLNMFEPHRDDDEIENINLLRTVKLGTMIDFEHISLNFNVLLNLGNSMHFAIDSKNTEVLIPNFSNNGNGRKRKRDDEQLIDFRSNKIGTEVNINFLKILYVGAGTLIDINSSYTMNGRTTDINSHYPFAKAGIMIQPHHSSGFIFNVGATMMWNEKSYGGTFLNAAIMIKI